MAIDAGLIRWPLRDVFVAAFIGFPIALLVSWFYDITRRGLLRTPPVGADDSFDKSLHTRDYLLFASLAAVWALAIVFVHTPAPVDKSIAILAFENPGQDPDNAMFAFGIRLDLQTQLQNITDLKIIARESSDRIDSNMSIAEAGLKLGAAYIMKGSVERVLNRIRINVILIDAQNEQQTWVRSYDRELSANNWFDIRNEISSVITNSLQAQLLPAEQDSLTSVPTASFAAHQAYLLGQDRMANRSTAALAEAISYFQEAIDLDPDYALAWVGLADSLFLQMAIGGLPEEEEFPKIEAAIDKALELDDSLGEAYVTRGAVLWQKGESVAAAATVERALELSPSYPHAYRWYGIVLIDLGREEDALFYRRKAQALNPLSPIINMNVAISLSDLGRFDEALTQLKKVIEIDPSYPNAHEGVGSNYADVQGRMDQAVVSFRKAIALDPGQASSPRKLGFIYMNLGDTFKAEEWLRISAIVQPLFFLSDMIMEPLYLHRGDEEEALVYARKNIEIESRGPYTLRTLRNHDLRAGRDVEARAQYEQAYPELFQGGEPDIDGGNYLAAIDLSLVLIRNGELERANLLLSRSLEYLPSIPRLGGMGRGYGISDVTIYALQGKTDAALSALRKAIDNGWRSGWWFYLEHDPALDSIRDEPEFQAMLAKIKADMAAQLERVRAMEASGELEPIPDIN